MTIKDRWREMVTRALWPRAQEPFLDMDTLAMRLERTAKNLREQVLRLERASKQNERVTDRLIEVMEHQKDRLHNVTKQTEETLAVVEEHAAQQEVKNGGHKNGNGNGNGVH